MKRSRRSARISPTVSYAKTGNSGESTAGVRRVVSFVHFFVLSIFLLVTATAAVSTYQGLRTHSFIETSGVVTERNVSRGKWRPHSNTPIRFYVYRLEVKYTYDFQGITYEGEQIEAGTFGMANGAVVRRFRSRFQVGETVPVYVDPNDHGNAVLERGLSSMTTMFHALFGFFALITLILRVFYVAITTDVQPGEQPGTKVGTTAVQQ